MVEISLKEDRAKVEIYASGGILEYWIADTVYVILVEVYIDIVDGTYTWVTPSRRGETLSPVAFLDVSVCVEDILVPSG